LTGVILGLTASFIGFPAIMAVVAILAVATLYEGLEVLSRVAEDAENVIADIALVAIGAWLALAIASAYSLSFQTQAIIYSLSLIACVMLIQYGWRNYLANESLRKGSYKYLKLALYVITIIGIKLAIVAFYYGTSQSAY
jgi:hypothetical protein